jgi:hypothetical protein
VDAGHEEPRDLEGPEHVRAHEREVHVAGARSIGVEGRLVLPAEARHGTAPDDGTRARRHRVDDCLAERVELRRIAAEDEPDERLALLRFGHPALDLGRCGCARVEGAGWRIGIERGAV